MAKRTKKPRDASITITGCTFTAEVDESVVEAVAALARAAEENAKAIQRAADKLKLPDSPMLYVEGERG